MCVNDKTDMQRTVERRFFDDTWTMKTENQVRVEQQSLGNKIISGINHERKLELKIGSN